MPRYRSTGQTGSGATGPIGPTGLTGPIANLPLLLTSMSYPEHITGNSTSALQAWDPGYDPGGSFNLATGTFTAPTSGQYKIDATTLGGPLTPITVNQSTAQGNHILIQKNGVTVDTSEMPRLDVNILGVLQLNVPLTDSQTVAATVVSLAQGDTVRILVENPSSVTTGYTADLEIVKLP